MSFRAFICALKKHKESKRRQRVVAIWPKGRPKAVKIALSSAKFFSLDNLCFDTNVFLVFT